MARDLNIHEATKLLGYSDVSRTRQLLGRKQLRGRKKPVMVGGVPTGSQVWVVSDTEVMRFLATYRKKAIRTELTDEQRARLERVDPQRMSPADWDIVYDLHEEGVSVRVFVEYLGMARDALTTRFRRHRARLKEAS